MAAVAQFGKWCVLASLSLFAASCNAKRQDAALIPPPASAADVSPKRDVTITTGSAQLLVTSVVTELTSAQPSSIPLVASPTSNSRPNATSAAPAALIRAPRNVESQAAVDQPATQASIATSAVTARLLQSAVQTGEGFRVYLQGTSPVRVGQTSAFTVVVEPQAPFKSNDKYPYRFAGLNARGVTLASDKVTNAAVTPTRTTLSVNVTGTQPGDGMLEGTLSFSVCTQEKCLIERASLQIAFAVSPSD